MLNKGFSEEGNDLFNFKNNLIFKKLKKNFLGVLEEAEFYNLPHLVTLCTERIAERNKLKKIDKLKDVSFF